MDDNHARKLIEAIHANFGVIVQHDGNPPAFSTMNVAQALLRVARGIELHNELMAKLIDAIEARDE